MTCGNVVKTAQASVFGFPNSIIGVSSFPILVLIGVLILLEVFIPRWMLQVIALVSGLATLFVSWLAFQSIYVIEILCPYCIVVWAMTVPITANQAKVKNPVNGIRSFNVEFLELFNKSLVVKKKIGTVMAQTTIQ